jgi:SAM-dependent methyltransferase
VTGCDFSEEMIRISQRYCPKAAFFVKDIYKPLDLGLFDGIYAQAVLLHVPKRQIKDVLKNLSNSLKPNGYLYIAVKEIKEGQNEEDILKENDYGYEYDRFFSYYTMDEIQSYLADLGFKNIYDQVFQQKSTRWIQVIAQK